MVKEFNKLKEIQKYYDEKTNTYVFKEDGEWIDLVVFNFDLCIYSNIIARNIKASDIDAFGINVLDINANNIYADNIDARDITAKDIHTDNFTARVIKVHNIVAGIINVININAYDIDATAIMAGNIKAHNIKYFTVCFAEKDIICNSIKGKREGTKHFVFDGKLEVKMEFKTLEEEIEYVYSNRINKEFVRNENFMFKIIVSATNTYTNLSLFYNDYRNLYEIGIIDENWYISSVNDLYLLALIHTNKNDWDRIIQEKQKDERARLKERLKIMTNIERKIEFRVLVENPKTMRYNVSIHARQIFTGYCWIPFDNNIKLMQYTGLKDKNGVKIFEGDIVRTYKLNANKHFEDRTSEYDEFIGVIAWNENCLKYCIQKNNTKYKNMLKPSERYYEVIGNIYENGDLLI